MESPILEKIFQAEMANEVYTEYFTVNFPPFVFASGNANVEFSQQIPNDSDFLLREVNRAAFQPAGTYVENPDCLITLQDSGSGRLFNNSQLGHIVTVTGTGQRPFILPEPRIIAGGNAFSVSVTNQSGGNFAGVYITLIGTKIFYRGGFSVNDILGGNPSWMAANQQ